MESAAGSAIGIALLVSSALAQSNLPDLAPSVRVTFPLGVRSGDTAEVEMHGRNLDDAKSLIFTRSDIRAQILSSDFFSLKAKISAGPDVPAGIYDYRLATARGQEVRVL